MEINFTVNTEDVEASCRRLLGIVRPSWCNETIKFKRFTDGISNDMIGCYINGNEDMLLVRVYGANSELLIDRLKEKQSMKILHKAGMCAPLYASFSNGLCYGFIEGVTLDDNNISHEHMQKLIAREMVALHSLTKEEICAVTGEDVTAPIQSRYKTRMESLWGEIPECFDDPEKQKVYKAHVPEKNALLAELHHLLAHLDKVPSRVVFCHNDLLIKNLIFSEKEDRIYFIDYEYADYGFQVYDIANHFAEYAGVEVVNYNNLPDKTTQLRFLRHYLTFWNRRHHPGRPITDNDLEILYVKVNKFILASHLMWSFWALIQAKYSVISFDYLGYAITRLNEYFSKHDAAFALHLPTS